MGVAFKCWGRERSLKHVLRAFEGASSARQLKRFKNDILTGSDLLSSAVSTRSVFEKGKLVKDLLSSEELMDAYDLDLTVVS
jgi:hypothetical protein